MSFADKWAALAIDETLQVPPSETITHRTLATVRHGGTTRPPSDLVPPVSELPELSLAFSEKARDTQSERSLEGIPDITVAEILGAGGMGEVRRAQQRSLKREVAIKTLPPGADLELANALVHEAVLTGFLSHPGIIPVHSLGRDSAKTPVLVMKRIEGASWSELLADPDHPAWVELDARAGGDRLLANLQILEQICDAVHFAHSRGVVHRDIKPANVMLGRFGEVYLVDWGVATRLRDHFPDGMVGTPAFMAPEMIDGAGISERTDVYLLGATLHAVLTGQVRHPGDSLKSVLELADRSAPYDYPASVPSPLAELCNRATSADPALRPESALAFRNAIGDFLRRRASFKLSAASRQRLANLADLLGSDPDAPLSEEAWLDANTSIAEARFGFTQALDEWPENDDARDGKGRCLEAQIDLLLRRGDVAAARVLMRSLAEINIDFERRAEKLEAELAHEMTQKERLAKLERDFDKNVSRSARIWAFALLGLTAVASFFWVDHRHGSRSSLGLSHVEVLGMSIVFLVVGGGAFLWMRRALMANAFNRRLISLALAMLILVVIDRSLGWLMDMPVRHIFLMDTMVFVALSVAGTRLLERWLKWVVGIQLASAILIASLPEAATAPVFGIAAITSFIVMLVFWGRQPSS